jgi:hypothetical protein
MTGTKAKRGHTRTVKQVIKRGILCAFYSATYTADILIMEATSAYLRGVPVACHLDGTSAQINAMCAVLFFDEQNYSDAVILAVYPNGSQGIPVPAPGRVVITTGYQQFVNQVINNNTTYTATLAGHGGIPVGSIAVLMMAYFTSPSANAYVQFAPHGGAIGNYITLGNLAVAGGFINGWGILPVDSAGKIDIKANNGNCTVTLATQGYVQ